MVQRFGGTTRVSLCKVYLRTDFLSIPVLESVQDMLPIEGVTFLLVCDPPLRKDPVGERSRTFPLCAVTCSQARSLKGEDLRDRGHCPDISLSNLFLRLIICESDYIKNDVLMRKYRPFDVSANEPWSGFHQIVIPKSYRDNVLSLAHDNIDGYLGVKKDSRSS